MKKMILVLSFVLMTLPQICSAAIIDTALYLGNTNIMYPVIFTGNPEAEGKINSEIRNAVKNFTDGVKAESEEYGSPAEISVGFSIPCNEENGILSIILEEYVNYEGSAHPMIFQRTLNFNSDSGVRLTVEGLSEIAKEEFGESAYSPKNITRKLKAFAKSEGIELYPDFKELETVPEDFYFDSNLHVRFIFQKYDVAPYAVGIIDIDAG